MASYLTKVSVTGVDEKIPVLGLSTRMGMDPVKARQCFARAVNRGLCLLDTAYSDLCEQELGKVLNLCWRRGDARNEFFIITKLPLIGMRWNTVNRFLDMSLKNLGLDYVDAFLIEAPVGLQYISDTEVCPVDEKGNCLLDMTTDLLEIWRHMEISYTSGRARMIGVCNFNMEQVDCLVNKARIPPFIAQFDINAYNMRCIEREKLENLGVAVMGTYVTGNPLLEASEKQPILRKHPRVKEIARAHNVNTPTVLIKYLIQLRIVSLVKFTCVDELEKICETIDSFTLTNTEMSALESLDLGGDARLRDFVNYKGCQNHPEFPFFYDARHPEVNPGKWKRCRNPYGTPPRYDYLDPNCPFPVNEYDTLRRPGHAQQGPSLTAATRLPHVTDTEDNMNAAFHISHEARSKKDSEQHPVYNAAFPVPDTPPQVSEVTPNITSTARDAQTQTPLEINAKGCINLTLVTGEGYLKGIPTHFRGEFCVSLQPNDDETTDAHKEIECKQQKLHHTVKKNHTARINLHLPKEKSSPRISPLAQVHTAAKGVPEKVSGEERHRKRRETEALHNPPAKKCGCECQACDKKRSVFTAKKMQ